MCGIVGVFGHPDAAWVMVRALHQLQHRGQETAGGCSADGRHFFLERRDGWVVDTLNDENVIERLQGTTAIGHVRYSTTGKKWAKHNAQPLFAELGLGGLAVAHNGEFTNAVSLRKQLKKGGQIFQSTMDTEVLVHLVAKGAGNSLPERLAEALRQLEGSYALVLMSQNELIAARDPQGIRPLVLGRFDGAYVVASETCALGAVGARYVRDVKPGEVLFISRAGMQSAYPHPPLSSRPCIFEWVYFARPDSTLGGVSVHEARRRAGAELARESPVDADVVVPIPDSGTVAGQGYAAETGLPFEPVGIVRSHYVGRTFIEPTDPVRHFGVGLKHRVVQSVVSGKRVVLLDDSIVRGTTSPKIVEMVREAGAREVHVRIACPPFADPCRYGIDTPTHDELLAAQMNGDVERMRRYIGADSLAFLSLDGLYRAVGGEERNSARPQFCDACLSSEYPTRLTDVELGSVP